MQCSGSTWNFVERDHNSGPVLIIKESVIVKSCDVLQTVGQRVLRYPFRHVGEQQFVWVQTGIPVLQGHLDAVAGDAVLALCHRPGHCKCTGIRTLACMFLYMLTFTHARAHTTELYTNWSVPRGIAEKGLVREKDGAVPPCLKSPVSAVRAAAHCGGLCL